MILVIDTFGNSYFSLSQARIDSGTFYAFINFLCEKLNTKELGWKKNTILLVDRASYDTSKQTK
jgi:hypothetical protein